MGLLLVVDGRLSDHHVTVIVDNSTKKILRIVRDELLVDERDKFSNSEYRTPKEMKEFDEHVANLPDLSYLEDVYEKFPWYYKEAMEAIARIGNPRDPRFLEFMAYERMGHCIGHTAGLARADFQ